MPTPNARKMLGITKYTKQTKKLQSKASITILAIVNVMLVSLYEEHP